MRLPILPGGRVLRGGTTRRVASGTRALGAAAPLSMPLQMPLQMPPKMLLAMPLLMLLGACSSGSTDTLSGLASLGAPRVPIPNQVAGGDASDPALRRGTDREVNEEDLSPEDIQARRVERTRAAARLWAQAQIETDPEEAADVYAEIAEDYPDFAYAAEARYREAVGKYRQGDDIEAFDRFKLYMSIAPVNPYLREIEEIIFAMGVRTLRSGSSGGITSLFDTDTAGVDMLRYVPQTFPAGIYADDALYVLGRHFQGERDHDVAVLTYKEILLRYNQSEWSYMAQLALGDTYLERDQGAPYHAGFVDRDPREELASEEAAPHAGPVKSSLELALDQFESFLLRVSRDPSRRSEYAKHIQYAQGRSRQLREALAEKEMRTARFYSDRGEVTAARLYQRAAQRWRQGRVLGNEAAFPSAAPVGPAATPPPTPYGTPAWPTANPNGGAVTQPFAQIQPVAPAPFEGASGIDPATGLPYGEAPYESAPYVGGQPTYVGGQPRYVGGQPTVAAPLEGAPYVGASPDVVPYQPGPNDVVLPYQPVETPFVPASVPETQPLPVETPRPAPADGYGAPPAGPLR